jgi:hypothetical protein
VATWDDVARIVAELPETTEASPRDWRVRKKLMVWERPLRKADYEALGADAPDGDILGARVGDEGVKFALIADDPGCTSPPRTSTATRRCWSDWPRSTCPNSPN